AARVLRGRGSRRHRPLAAGLPAGASAPATHDPAQGPVLAVGLAGPGRQHGAGYRPRARTAFGLRVRAGPRAVPPAAGQPFTRVLARGRAALPGLARGTRVLPPRGKATEGAPARPARLRLHTPAIPGTPGDGYDAADIQTGAAMIQPTRTVLSAAVLALLLGACQLGEEAAPAAHTPPTPASDANATYVETHPTTPASAYTPYCCTTVRTASYSLWH